MGRGMQRGFHLREWISFVGISNQLVGGRGGEGVEVSLFTKGVGVGVGVGVYGVLYNPTLRLNS